MACTYNQMKENLVNARRSASLELSPEHCEVIKSALAKGLSKKALTALYGITYEDLKAIKNA